MLVHAALSCIVDISLGVWWLEVELILLLRLSINISVVLAIFGRLLSV